MATYLDRTTDILGRLISYPTISDQSNLDMIAELRDRLEDDGARVDVWYDETGAKANLFATLGPEGDGGIVLSGHTDVVPVADQDWTTDPFLSDIRDGRVYGRGSCDMKGFIAACVALAPLFARKVARRPVHFAFTYDEETGCFGGQALIESLRAKGLRPGLALIGEPTSMRVIEGHKGCYEYSTHFHGLAGHGSDPERGVNAVEYAARYVARLLELKDALRERAPRNGKFDPPWTTINTGALNGGVAHNVIPSSARVDWEMRPVQASDADFVKDSLRDYCEDVLLPAMQAVDPMARIDTEIIAEVSGLEPAEANEARAIILELTGAEHSELVAFGTEAGLFQQYGMSAVVCGPGSIEHAHKPDEFVSLEQLSQCVGMLERLAETL
ncbi:acetylornithine deacetylase [Roseovarius sp. SCSIO 43702]|uniref:acetylornithine deacetylase n=1 Tax=Roseovarius sp. SCSIO 43702 TaxID=2823043 RepID=UPI001C72C7F0|nr:acetylornithine deacetylase [Roseovarius sp. SCSIO 43702]QYX55912.1 acetylornithine deacetylase [Roseovarius sp. SCSIO 43702]